MKRNTILTIAGILIAGSAIYFGIKWYQKSQADKNNIPPPPPPAPSAGNPTDLLAAEVENPFTSIDEIKAFQDWMDKNHPNWANGKNVNKGVGYGNFGPSTKAAWQLRGAEYLKSQEPPEAQLSESMKKDIQTIMANGTGDKSKESYLKVKANKYPSYVSNWAKAIRNRLESDGKQGTTFIFANQIYEAFSGNRIYVTTLTNKTPEMKANAKLRQNAKWNTATQPANGFNLGKIKGYFYNKNDKALFVYVPDNTKSSIYKWMWVGSIKL